MRLIPVFCGMLLCSFLTSALYHSKSHTDVVIFDGHVLQGQLIQQLALHNASSQQITAITSRFKKTRDTLLLDYAKDHRVVVLDKNQVVAGGEDITQVLTQQLALAMRKKT